MSINETPDELTNSDDELYNMSMEELEQMVNSKNLEQPLEDDDDDDDEEDSEEIIEEEPEELTDETEEEVDEDFEEDDAEEDSTDEPEESDEAPDSEEEEDQPTEESTDDGDNAEPQKPETYKVKAIGTEVEFTLDELKELASKGLDYTKKMQEISPWKKQIAAMKEYSVTQDDINMLIDLKKGNKDAVISLMKKSGIDPLDVDMESAPNYSPNNYSISDEQLAIREVVSRLSVDRDIYARTEAVVDNEWDSKSRAEMLKNPAMIEGLHNDIKNGVFDAVLPMMTKLKALDGGRKSDLEYYMEAGQRLSQEQIQAKVTSEQKEVAQKEEQRKSRQEDIRQNSQRRKVASLPKSRASKKKDVINYLDEIPDEDYYKWLKKVESKF